MTVPRHIGGEHFSAAHAGAIGRPTMVLTQRWQAIFEALARCGKDGVTLSIDSTSSKRGKSAARETAKNESASITTRPAPGMAGTAMSVNDTADNASIVLARWACLVRWQMRLYGASVEDTLTLWASSLRDVKQRIRPLFTQRRVAASAGEFLDGLLGNEPRKTGWMRAEAAHG